MPIDLQDSVVYGPIHSRRLGHSLGINLLPLSWKLCDFDCVYWQYGWTPQTPGREKIKRVGELEPLIEEAFKGFREAHETIDCITLAGNGEPALHPDFMEIIRATKRLRDIYFPEARVGILTDASLIHKPKVREALLELDDRYLKLDVASKEDLLAINRPVGDFDWDRFVEALRQFPDKVIQSLFISCYVGAERNRNVPFFTRIFSFWVSNILKSMNGSKPALEKGKLQGEISFETTVFKDIDRAAEAVLFSKLGKRARG